MSKLAFLALLLGAVLLLPACGPQLLDSPAKHGVLSPAKQPPPSAAIPATQRPYRIRGKTYYPLPSCEGFDETGFASWYGKDFHGKKTSNGETYDMYGQTAAHKLLPMNTYVLVKNLENNREEVVRINDRGPFVKGRIIDLTYSVAQKLGMVKNGTARVKITALGETATYRHGNGKIERFLPHQNFATGEFYVQIGSFVERRNADRLKERMLAWGKKTVIQPFTKGDKQYYRVQVRASRELAKAKRLERVLSEAGFPGAFVIAR